MNPKVNPISKATLDAMKLAMELSKSVTKGALQLGSYVILNNDGTKTYKVKK